VSPRPFLDETPGATESMLINGTMVRMMRFQFSEIEMGITGWIFSRLRVAPLGPNIEVGVVLEGNADEAGDGIERLLGQIGFLHPHRIRPPRSLAGRVNQDIGPNPGGEATEKARQRISRGQSDGGGCLRNNRLRRGNARDVGRMADGRRGANSQRRSEITPIVRQATPNSVLSFSYPVSRPY